MPLIKEQRYTAEDYWNLAENQRAELIDGKLYPIDMPNRIHQEIIGAVSIMTDDEDEYHAENPDYQPYMSHEDVLKELG